MDTKETNDLPKEAALEETLTDAAILTADNQQPESGAEVPEIVKTKTKRVPKAKASQETVKVTEETVSEAVTENINKPEISVETHKESDLAEETLLVESISDNQEEEKALQQVPGSKKEIIDLFKSLVENSSSDIKEKVDYLKQSFYKIHKQEIENARKVFLEAGNAIDNFIAEEDTLETDFKALLNNWREKRA